MSRSDGLLLEHDEPSMTLRDTDGNVAVTDVDLGRVYNATKAVTLIREYAGCDIRCNYRLLMAFYRTVLSLYS